MNGMHSREQIILPSMCDSAAKLGIPNTFALFMDIATEHAEQLGVGMKDLIPKGLFWLTVRSRARFYRRPGMVERVTAATWPEPPERARCNRDYRIMAGGETLIEGKTEWMIMNTRTGRLSPTDGVFPPDLEIWNERVLPEPFMRMNEDFSGADELGEYTVRSTDIDMGGHMNNAAYVRAIAGMFSSKEWNAMEISEMEMAYRAPCYEGETLRLQRREGDGGLEIRMSRGDRTIALARIRRANDMIQEDCYAL